MFSFQFPITSSLLIVHCGDCLLNLCFCVANSKMDSINTIYLFTSLILIFNNEFFKNVNQIQGTIGSQEGGSQS